MKKIIIIVMMEIKTDNSDSDSLQKREERNFFELIENEREEEINDFLAKNRNCEIWNYRTEDDKSTVLHVSIINNNYSIIKSLIKYIKKYNEKHLKDFINEKNNKGITALHYASNKGNVHIIKLLIKNGADEFSLSNRELNIFHFCAQGRKPNSLMYFYVTYKDHMEKRDLINLIKSVDMGGSTPLHWAAYSNAEELLLYILNLDIFQNEGKDRNLLIKEIMMEKLLYI